MKFLIDTQQDTLRTRMETSELILGQLLTPLTGYSDWGGVYVLGRRKLGRRYTHTPHTSIYRVLPSPLRFKLLLSAVQASCQGPAQADSLPL